MSLCSIVIRQTNIILKFVANDRRNTLTVFNARNAERTADRPDIGI